MAPNNLFALYPDCSGPRNIVTQSCNLSRQVCQLPCLLRRFASITNLTLLRVFEHFLFFIFVAKINTLLDEIIFQIYNYNRHFIFLCIVSLPSLAVRFQMSRQLRNRCRHPCSHSEVETSGVGGSVLWPMLSVCKRSNETRRRQVA